MFQLFILLIYTNMNVNVSSMQRYTMRSIPENGIQIICCQLYFKVLIEISRNPS